MALPKLNDTPKYDIVIPSTKMKTRFRPYLVKEEKLLLLALEGGDQNQISQAVIDLIKTCVDADISEKDLTTYDMDYLFCQIRSKSVGESVELRIRCEDTGCNTQTTVKVDVSKIGVDLSEKIQNMIELTPTVTVEMKHLSYYDLLNDDSTIRGQTENDILFDMIMKSITAIHTEDERINAKEESKEDLAQFLDEMTSKQYAKLRDFVLNMPQVTYNAEWDCDGCGKHQSMRLVGLQDFFQ